MTEEADRPADPLAPALIERFNLDCARLGIKEGETIGLAVSGGPDSLALLLLAAAARPGGVTVATVDHQLRPAAAEEARMVATLCARIGVPHAILPVSVADDPAGLQAAARAARYAALGRWASEIGAPVIATAHHLDDQAETVLMRLGRGAGVGGLSGIRRARAMDDGVRLIRPLLDWRKAELIAVCAAAGLIPADDPSNSDPRFDRTRARALLAGGWPAPERLAATAAHLADAEAALGWASEAEFARRVKIEQDGLTLDPAGLPTELLRRLVMLALAQVGGSWGGDGPAVGRLIDRLRRGDHATLGRVSVAPGLRWHFRKAPPRRSS